MSNTSSIVHKGFDDFSSGSFENGGDNLYVNARGEIEIIHQFDVNGDGYVDIVFPNAHGHIERGPTWIYKRDGHGEWSKQELPNDSGWVSRAIDVDGDGYPDLVVVNGENGVTSELDSYVYWGGPSGLTGERTELPTAGAYEVVAIDLHGRGRSDLIFTSTWVDHHNPGESRLLHVYEQVEPRRFEEKSEQHRIIGMAGRCIAGADLNRDGKLDLVVANYREDYEYDIESYIYWGTDSGFDTDNPLRLPSHYAAQVITGDLNNDGWEEIVFAGGSQVWIYWNREGRFDRNDRTILDFVGDSTEFRLGAIFTHIADVDGDGRNELVAATKDGVEIRTQDDLLKTASFLPLSSATWVETADLTGDGRLDMIVSRFQDGRMFDCKSAVFWNGPEGYSIDRVDWLPTSGAMGCSAADLDGDGTAEIIFNNTHRGWSTLNKDLPVYVYLGDEHNEYSVERRIDLPAGGSNTYAIADLNQDGYADLVCTASGGLRIFWGGPDGPSPDRFTDLPGKTKRTNYVLIGDLNRDGWLDLVSVAFSMEYDAESLANSSVIYYGSPDGFLPENAKPLPTASRGNAMLSDVNGDGWLDIICPDRRGYLGIFLGGPEGYSPDRMWKIPLKGIDVGFVPAVTVADLNEDGWLDIILSFMGHYTRKTSGFFILYGGPDGYSEERMEFHPTDASSILVSAADLDNDGHLELLVPAYSTQFTRELPAHIIPGNGKGFDFEHQVSIPCDSCCAFWAADITGNGFKDLLAVCHRNDLGHQVESLLFWNGPGGLDFDHPARLPGLGPHLSSARDFGSAYDREPVEHYVSPAIDLDGQVPVSIAWQGETPFKTELRFELKWAATEAGLKEAKWSGPDGPGSCYTESGAEIRGVDQGTSWMQYRIGFVSPNGCGTPRLTSVSVETT